MRTALATASLSVLLGLGACAGDDLPPAATVNGTEISQDAVIDELEAIRDNVDYVAGREAGGQQVLGRADSSFSAPFAAEVLANHIRQVLVSDELDQRDVDADDACTAAGREDVVFRLGAAVGSDAARGEVVLDAFPQWYQDELVERSAELLALQAELADVPCVSDDAVAALFAEDPAQFRQACFTVATVATAEEATAVRTQVDGGTALSALGGSDAGCPVRVSLASTAPLADAVFATPVGGVGGPVQSRLGWHVFVVQDIRPPELDAVRDQVAALLAQRVNERFQAWYAEAVDAAEVEVDERYGRWDPLSGTVRAPAPPS